MGIDDDTREFRTRPHPSMLSIGLSQLAPAKGGSRCQCGSRPPPSKTA